MATGADLTAVHCECASHAYPNPAVEAAFAPYEAVDGCLVPKRLEQLIYTSTNVQRSLHKPHKVSEPLNLTLRLTGTERVVTAWRVTNAGSLKTFIQLPQNSSSISADEHVVQLPLVLTALGRRERAQVYSDNLVVAVSSQTDERVATVRLRQFYGNGTRLHTIRVPNTHSLPAAATALPISSTTRCPRRHPSQFCIACL